MDSLPDHILGASLSFLPKVDVFRLIRVSQRFQQLVVSQLATLALDELELVLQLGERGLPNFRDYPKLAIGQIVENYGCLFRVLEVILVMLDTDQMHTRRELLQKIAGSCPLLFKLVLKPCCGRLGNIHQVSFPATSLPQLARLKVLRAVLTYPAPAAGHNEEADPSCESIVDKMLDMDEISYVYLDKDPLLLALGACGTRVCAVKGLFLVSSNLDASEMDLFPCAEAVVVCLGVSKPNSLAIIPSSVKKLAIMAPMVADMSTEDLEPLNRLVCLTEFCLYDPNGKIWSFDYLSRFAKLELLCIRGSINRFDADAFACIPDAAPLNCVILDYRPAVCKPEFGRLMKSKGMERLLEVDSGKCYEVCTDTQQSFGLVLVGNCHSLKEGHFMGCRPEIKSNGLLEQLVNDSILGLTALRLPAATTTAVTSAGMVQLLAQRRLLIRTAREQITSISKMQAAEIREPRVA